MNDNNRPNDVNHNNNGSSLPVQEHSSSRGPVSEIDLFKKQLEQGIKEPEEEAREETLSSSNKTLIIIACVLVGLALFGLGYLIGMNAGLNNKSKCDDYVPINKDDKDKTEDKKDDNEVKEVDIDSSIKELYETYHTPVESNGKAHYEIYSFEKMIYSTDTFKISSINTIPSNISNVIYEKGKTEIEAKLKDDDEHGYKYIEKKDGEEIIKKYFKEIFGDNLKYKVSLFEKECQVFTYDKVNERFYISGHCGELTSSDLVEYKLIKAEKDNKYLYLTEDVTIEERDSEGNVTKTETGKYKWTLNKDTDGKYYFLRSEKQAK